MNTRRLLALSVAAVVAVWLALGAVGVHSAPDTDIPWSVFGAGGGTSSSTNFELGSTAGQSATGLSQSANFRLGAGYWYGAVDSDDDGIGNAADPCPAIADCDGDSLGLGDPFGLFFRDGVEVFIGTLPLVACAATPAINDEDPDAFVYAKYSGLSCP